jgi:hypothetical protein
VKGQFNMTFKNCCLVFYYTQPNKNSFLALVGAMEKDPHFDDLDIFFIESKKDLRVELSTIIPRYSKIIIGFSLCTPQITETIPIINKLRKCKWQVEMHLARKTILHLLERKKWFNPPLLFEF